jgi:Fe-S-cluster containining protein
MVILNKDMFSICKACRRCCIGTEIRLAPEDIERWKKESRLDILLDIDSLFGESRQLITKEKNNECIFLLDGGSCEIQDTKPYICKKFPVSRKQALLFDCKLADILNLK